MPTWSDGEAAGEGVPEDASATGATAAGDPVAAGDAAAPETSHESHACPWCATPAAEGATRC